MSFEGTGKYFLLLLIIYFIVFLTVKICLAKLFKGLKISGWKAFIPFYNKIVLIDKLELKKSIFLKTLIPFANLYYFKIIIARLLESYELNDKEAIWYLIVPMYKFPELVFRNPSFKLHLYDETEKFIHNEKSLFEQEVKPIAEVQEKEPSSETIINPSGYNQMPDVQASAESVFSNSSLEPDKRQETTYEAKKEEVKKEVNPIFADSGKPKVCPKCGTKLPGTAKVCFFCGAELS